MIDRGVQILTLWQELVISLVTLVGGGFLLYADRGDATVQTIAITSITAVITFWFSRRLSDAQANRQAAQNGPPAVPAAPSQVAGQAIQQAAETLLADPSQVNHVQAGK